MTPVLLTSLLVTAERHTPRPARTLGAMSVGRRFGDTQTTAETHTYSLPVVREMPPRPVSTALTW